MKANRIIIALLLVIAAAVAEHKTAAVLISNFKSEPRIISLAFQNAPWKGATRAQLFRTDDTHDFEKIGGEIPDAAGSRLRLEVPQNSVGLVQLVSQDGAG